MKDLEDILGVSGMSDMPASTQSSFSKTGLSGQIASDTTFNEWLGAESVTSQNKILGAKRAELWRDGKLELADMISSSSGRTLTLAELAKKI